MTSFPNLKLGTGILQQSLTLLVQYYHRWEILNITWQFLVTWDHMANIPIDYFDGHRDCADSAACLAWLHSLRSLQPPSWSTSTSSWWRWRNTSQASNSGHASFIGWSMSRSFAFRRCCCAAVQAAMCLNWADYFPVIPYCMIFIFKLFVEVSYGLGSLFQMHSRWCILEGHKKIRWKKGQGKRGGGGEGTRVIHSTVEQWVTVMRRWW